MRNVLIMNLLVRMILAMINIYIENDMYCDKSIHFYLYEENYVQCPFCYNQIQKSNAKKYSCCEKMTLINDNTAIICNKCGTLIQCLPCNEYIDFYENMYKLKRKAVYNRKYHLQNRITNLCLLNNITISYKDRQKILDIFKIIGYVIPIIIIQISYTVRILIF